jgi:hypothetical protein
MCHEARWLWVKNFFQNKKKNKSAEQRAHRPAAVPRLTPPPLPEFQSLPRVWFCAESQIKNSRHRKNTRQRFLYQEPTGWLSANNFFAKCNFLTLGSWVDLKTKFIEAFQIFHETKAQSSYLYNCKQKDREPLWNFVRGSCSRDSDSEADDKTTIQALIKGLTPGQTASHLTRKKPKTIDELFHELEEYIMSAEEYRRRAAERNDAR